VEQIKGRRRLGGEGAMEKSEARKRAGFSANLVGVGGDHQITMTRRCFIHRRIQADVVLRQSGRVFSICLFFFLVALICYLLSALFVHAVVSCGLTQAIFGFF
jgi:hypothetical protein